VVVSCTAFYEDGAEMLRRSLLSLKAAGVDCIIAADGPYCDFPHEANHSKDGCLAVAKKHADVLIASPTLEGWKNQIAKRNAMFLRPSRENFYFVLDADEYLEGTLPKNLTTDCYAIPVFDVQADGSVKFHEWQIRIFRAYDDLQYKKKHSWCWHGAHILTQDIYNPTFEKIESLRMIHDKQSRPAKRKASKAIYYANRWEDDTINPPIRKVYPPGFERTKYLKVLKTYYGFDIDGEVVAGNPADLVIVTDKKCEQLLADYPESFEFLGGIDAITHHA
jgi:hypothetical protein